MIPSEKVLIDSYSEGFCFKQKYFLEILCIYSDEISQGQSDCLNSNADSMRFLLISPAQVEIFLKKDSENRYDKNAVQVLDYSGKILGYIPRYYSESVAELLETEKKIVCHVYNVDKSKNCNECIKMIMEIKN